MESETCLDDALIQNGWAEQEDLDIMEPAAKKSLLMLQLNKNLDGEKHSFPELSVRPEKGPTGGICGMAALYQALVNTILTPSQLTLMNYQTMRTLMAKEMGEEPDEDKPDAKVLEAYHKC